MTKRRFSRINCKCRDVVAEEDSTAEKAENKTVNYCVINIEGIHIFCVCFE